DDGGDARPVGNASDARDAEGSTRRRDLAARHHLYRSHDGRRAAGLPGVRRRADARADAGSRRGRTATGRLAQGALTGRAAGEGRVAQGVDDAERAADESHADRRRRRLATGRRLPARAPRGRGCGDWTDRGDASPRSLDHARATLQASNELNEVLHAVCKAVRDANHYRAHPNTRIRDFHARRPWRRNRTTPGRLPDGSAAAWGGPRAARA